MPDGKALSRVTDSQFIVPTESTAAWPRQFSRTKRDKDGDSEPKTTYGNVALVIEHAEFFSELRFNELTREIEFNGLPLDAVMVGQLRAGIEYAYKFAPVPEQLHMALGTRARRNAYHPVREYLTGLQWDGVPRLDTVASAYLGAADTALNRAYLRKWFISAVARPMKPGCKVDTALVLIGPQGLGKSTFFAALGGPWFSDTEVPLGDKDGLMMLGSAWLYELGEIDGMTRRAAAAEVKRILSTQVDRFRAPYATAPESVPRGVVIVGSTNETQFLNDPTGSRRFWCVRVPRTIDRSAVERDRDQLWAEAVVAWRAGEQWWLSESEDGARAQDSEVHQADDPWEELILDWIARNPKALITPNAVLAGLGIDAGKRGRAELVRVGTLLRKNGYDTRKNPENTSTGKARPFRLVELEPDDGDGDGDRMRADL